MKTTPPRRRRQAKPRKQKIVAAVGTATGVRRATGKGRATHAAAGSSGGGAAAIAKGRTILAGKHRYGLRKNWGKLEFAQDALQARYGETLPVYVSPEVLEEIHEYLRHDPKYRATYRDHKIDRMTVTRALQKQSKIRR